jgi:hypothetical protein
MEKPPVWDTEIGGAVISDGTTFGTKICPHVFTLSEKEIVNFGYH